MTEDEMVGWYHRCDGHEFEQAPGVGDGQGSLVCCSPWGSKDMGLTPGLGRSPGEGHGNPLQYSCLENPTDRGAWQATSVGLQSVEHK